MTIILWILQIILAIKLLTAAFSHGLRQDSSNMADAMRKMGAQAKPIHMGVAIFNFLGAVGMVLPGVLGTALWITPFTAGVMGLLLLLSIVVHVRTREKPQIFVSLVLFVFAAVIMIGRMSTISG